MWIIYSFIYLFDGYSKCKLILNYYDSEFKILGFIKLSDYTAPSIPGVAKLFAHPEHYCFAEVTFLENTPVFC